MVSYASGEPLGKAYLEAGFEVRECPLDLPGKPGLYGEEVVTIKLLNDRFGFRMEAVAWNR